MCHRLLSAKKPVCSGNGGVVLRDFMKRQRQKSLTYKFHEEWKEGVGLFLVPTVIVQIEPESMGKLYKPDKEKDKPTGDD